MMKRFRTFALAAVLTLGVTPLSLAGAAPAAAPANAPTMVGMVFAQAEPEAPAPAEEGVTLTELLELFQDAFAGPAAGGAFVAAALFFVRRRFGAPRGIFAVASVLGGSLALGLAGATVGPIEGGVAAGVAFGMKTFAAAIAERELLVNALRSITGEGSPQSDARQDSARHRTARSG